MTGAEIVIAGMVLVSSSIVIVAVAWLLLVAIIQRGTGR